MAENAGVPARDPTPSEGGRSDSPAAFSVQLARSVARLAQFQHKSPNHFLRHLISALAALGSQSLTMHIGPERWSFEFDGEALSFDDLKAVFPSLVALGPGRKGVALRELGLALNNLRLIQECHIQLSGPSGRLEVDPHYLQIVPGKQRPLKMTAVEVRPLSALERVTFFGLQHHASAALPPLDLSEGLRDSRLAPFARSLNGVMLGPDLEWGPALALARLQGSTQLPPIRCQARIVLESRHSGELSLCAALYPRFPPPPPGDAETQLLQVLNFGLLFEREPLGLSLGSRVLACHDGLKRDVMGTHLIENQDLLVLTARAREQVAQLAVEAFRQLEPGSPDRIGVQRGLTRLWSTPEIPVAVRRILEGVEFLELGWERPYSPSQVSALASSQGFLHFDPSKVEVTTRQALAQFGRSLIEQSPYRQLQPWPDGRGPCLIHLPTPHGEIRVEDRWPGSPGHVVGEAQLPDGIEILLHGTPPTDELADPFWRSQLGVLERVWSDWLEADPLRYLGSAPALRLSLWLGNSAPETWRRFRLRRYPQGTLALSELLSEGQAHYVEWGGALPPVQRSRVCPWLTREEVENLSRPRGPLTLTRLDQVMGEILAAMTYKESTAKYLVRQAAEVIGASGSALWRHTADGQLEFVAGHLLQAGEREDFVVPHGGPSLRELLLQGKPGAGMIQARTGGLYRGLRAYAITPIRVGQAVWGVLYVERVLKLGIFQEPEDLDKLCLVADQAGALTRE